MVFTCLSVNSTTKSGLLRVELTPSVSFSYTVIKLIIRLQNIMAASFMEFGEPLTLVNGYIYGNMQNVAVIQLTEIVTV